MSSLPHLPGKRKAQFVSTVLCRCTFQRVIETSCAVAGPWMSPPLQAAWPDLASETRQGRIQPSLLFHGALVMFLPSSKMDSNFSGGPWGHTCLFTATGKGRLYLFRIGRQAVDSGSACVIDGISHSRRRRNHRHLSNTGSP